VGVTVVEQDAYCPTCKKSVKVKFVIYSETDFDVLNPHEHEVTVPMCPLCRWIVKKRPL